MPSFFKRVKDGFWGFVSPRKTHERRDKPFKAPGAPASASASRALARKKGSRRSNSPSTRRTMSPDARVSQWRAGSPSTMPPPPIPPTPVSLAPASQLSTSPEQDPDYDVEFKDSAIFDKNNDTVAIAEDQLEESIFDIEAERAKWEEKADAQRAEGWSDHGIEIFRRIGMRGIEPILPASWKLDFPTVPAELFTEDEDETFINTTNKDFRAIRALQKLFELGARVRDARDGDAPIQGRGPQDAIHREIETYMKWAHTDGDVNGPSDVPVLHFEIGSVKTSPAEMQENMLARFEATAEYFREVLSTNPVDEEEEHDRETDGARQSIEPPSEQEYVTELPTLYGVIASHTIVALVAYNMSAAEPAVQIIAVLDYGDVRYDVWNSLAVAMLCVHCRNQMALLKPLLEFEEDEEELENEDPDA